MASTTYPLGNRGCKQNNNVYIQKQKTDAKLFAYLKRESFFEQYGWMKLNRHENRQSCIV